jgi:hypothetical protein
MRPSRAARGRGIRVDHLLGLAVIVGILVTITLISIRSVERASAERGRCEPCRIDEGVARQTLDFKGGGP